MTARPVLSGPGALALWLVAGSAWAADAAEIDGYVGERACVQTTFESTLCGELGRIDEDDFTVTLDNGSQVALHQDDIVWIGSADDDEAGRVMPGRDATERLASERDDPQTLQKRGRTLAWAGAGIGTVGLGCMVGGGVLTWRGFDDLVSGNDSDPLSPLKVVGGGLLLVSGLGLGVNGAQLGLVGGLRAAQADRALRAVLLRPPAG